jgi:hypothetical protein
METPKTYAFPQRSYNDDFRKGDIVSLDYAPRDSYHKCWVLIIYDKKLKPFKYREVVQNKALLIPIICGERR